MYSAPQSDLLLSFTPTSWLRLISELQRRGAGRSESGAFLLASATGSPRRVIAVSYYDDLDARALRGGLALSSQAFTRLWDLCERHGVKVVGDIHTHPWAIVRQSGIDRANPMVARVGHVALIVPNFGRGPITARDVGLHQYLGDRGWQSWFGDEAFQRIDTDGAW